MKLPHNERNIKLLWSSSSSPKQFPLSKNLFTFETGVIEKTCELIFITISIHAFSNKLSSWPASSDICKEMFWPGLLKCNGISLLDECVAIWQGGSIYIFLVYGLFCTLLWWACSKYHAVTSQNLFCLNQTICWTLSGFYYSQWWTW